MAEICELQEELARKVNPTKKQYEIPPSDGVYERMQGTYYGDFKAAKQTRASTPGPMPCRPESQGAGRIDSRSRRPRRVPLASFARAWSKLEEHVVRDLILSGTRPDGRGSKDLRAIHCEIDVLPRVHGSAVFQRGETQALITITLGHQP